MYDGLNAVALAKIGHDEWADAAHSFRIRLHFRSVSYTHLDVYKRQMQRSLRESLDTVARDLNIALLD